MRAGEGKQPKLCVKEAENVVTGWQEPRPKDSSDHGGGLLFGVVQQRAGVELTRARQGCCAELVAMVEIREEAAGRAPGKRKFEKAYCFQDSTNLYRTARVVQRFHLSSRDTAESTSFVDPATRDADRWCIHKVA